MRNLPVRKSLLCGVAILTFVITVVAPQSASAFQGSFEAGAGGRGGSFNNGEAAEGDGFHRSDAGGKGFHAGGKKESESRSGPAPSGLDIGDAGSGGFPGNLAGPRGRSAGDPESSQPGTSGLNAGDFDTGRYRGGQSRASGLNMGDVGGGGYPSSPAGPGGSSAGDFDTGRYQGSQPRTSGSNTGAVGSGRSWGSPVASGGLNTREGNGGGAYQEGNGVNPEPETYHTGRSAKNSTTRRGGPAYGNGSNAWRDGNWQAQGYYGGGSTALSKNGYYPGGCGNCGGPAANAAAAGAANAFGTAIATTPEGCPTINVKGVIYSVCNGTWFQPIYGPDGTYYRVVPSK